MKTPFLKCRFMCIILSLFLLATTAANTESAIGLFGSQEYKSYDLSSFKKWTDLKKRQQNYTASRYRKSNFTIKKPCRLSRRFKCVSEEWNEVILSLNKETPTIKMATINRYLNQTQYVTDQDNWKQQDYWASLDQFFNNAGDCEDFAIAKYFSLKELGFETDQMRIVIVKDTKSNIDHAVLSVYLDGYNWILDNQEPQIMSASNIDHYKPIYSINENAWWLHKFQ
ncbi:MAG: hypothetical protein HOH19_03110 [Kordiimonadaceae bacterium]|jgi:predicted transglutaminase-like cysteine proteinase|nr:hypothetical protein [Kordiimonadaceae bacterium]MBT6031539.1 hypothetical protein [Kordiimonadaceae bacterium]